MDHVVTQASSISSNFRGKYLDRQFTHTTLAETLMEEDWIGTNMRKVYNCMSKDLDLKKTRMSL